MRALMPMSGRVRFRRYARAHVTEHARNTASHESRRRPTRRATVMASTGLAGIWVRLADWVLVEADLPKPVAGTVLAQMGIRVYGALEQANDTAEDGLITESLPSAADPRTPVYLVTGRVESSRVFDTNMGSGMRPAGLELVIGVGGFRLQAQVDGKADDVATGSRGAVRGTLFVIGQYEWEDFGLVDTRGDLKIEETLNQPDGDYLLRLAVPQSP
jgi:hypothetical protein